MNMDQASSLRRLTQNAPAKRARVITVASGKGGVGKTNLVVNLGIQLARMGQVTTIVDADMGLANVDVLLGQSFEADLRHVLEGRHKLEDIIGLGPEGVRIVPSGSGVSQLADMNANQRRRLVSELGTLENTTDFLLIDTGAGISRNVLAFANLADQVVVVITPEPTSLADAYGLVKLLYRTKTATNIGVVVNRALSHADGSDTGAKFAAIVERFLGLTVAQLGHISDDPLVAQAVRRQRPFVVANPQGTASRQVESLARVICGDESQAPPAGRGLMAGLMRIFGG